MNICRLMQLLHNQGFETVSVNFPEGTIFYVVNLKTKVPALLCNYKGDVEHVVYDKKTCTWEQIQYDCMPPERTD